jgi:hypothetical protein
MTTSCKTSFLMLTLPLLPDNCYRLCYITQSIRSYFANDDDFNWNYGLALAATGKFREAEEALGAVQSDKYR